MFDSCFAGSVMRSIETPRSLNKYVALPAREFLTAGDADEPVPDDRRLLLDLADALSPVRR